MSYTPMSDLGQQGLFDITRTLLQQPDLASLCEALSQLVKRSALADNAAIVLWQAQTQRASYYASREKDTPIDAPRDKCAHFREINGIAAAFQHLQKNYIPAALSFL